MYDETECSSVCLIDDVKEWRNLMDYDIMRRAEDGETWNAWAWSIGVARSFAGDALYFYFNS